MVSSEVLRPDWDHLRVCGADARLKASQALMQGSSPRVRSRHHAEVHVHDRLGIISACAEQTPHASSSSRSPRDHLRVCGADVTDINQVEETMGSSPRVRSRHCMICTVFAGFGIISACAEQTVLTRVISSSGRDHLRVCGADVADELVAALDLGSSPRVRSRHRLPTWSRPFRGIISACAEQTLRRPTRPHHGRDHLRVCGADLMATLCDPFRLGSSPRVRSRPHVVDDDVTRGGIISACAEQTVSSASRSGSARDHLRVCGADSHCTRQTIHRSGSSPRVRSRHIPRPVADEVSGIISACAEQTHTVRGRQSTDRDHLRVCGADTSPAPSQTKYPGSSPRVRSRLAFVGAGAGAGGIISACAEQTIRYRVHTVASGDHLRVCGADFVAVSFVGLDEGSSPRVRSRRRPASHRPAAAGIISACAEQTTGTGGAGSVTWDHLRVCGADESDKQEPDWKAGSSPRVRSRLPQAFGLPQILGIISACAEQTSCPAADRSARRDHLRVCGADGVLEPNGLPGHGSSPRVRSRRDGWKCASVNTGIISACAEQTSPSCAEP